MKNIYCANLKLPVNDVMIDKNWLSQMPNKGHFPIPEKEVNPELLPFAVP